MANETYLYALFSSLIGVLLGWWISRLVTRPVLLEKNRELSELNQDYQALRESSHQQSTELAVNKQHAETLEETISELRSANEHLSSDLIQAREKASLLEGDIREKKVTLQAETEKLCELKEQFEHQKRELKNEFNVLSEKIFSERQNR